MFFFVFWMVFKKHLNFIFNILCNISTNVWKRYILDEWTFIIFWSNITRLITIKLPPHFLSIMLFIFYVFPSYHNKNYYCILRTLNVIHLRVWPALGWASNTTTDASSRFTEFGRWARAFCSLSSSNISSKSSGVLSELLSKKKHRK
jgi:hypothetical protein